MQDLFESQLKTVDAALSFVRRRSALSPADAEDFASFVKLKLIDDDYAILRKFSGRSSLRTYLTVVIQRLLLDFQDRAWGRWRPSAEARRRGPVAVMLDRLLSREGHSLAEACEVLLTNHRLEATRDELMELAATLPPRMPRRHVGDEALEAVPGPSRSAEQLAIDGQRERRAGVVAHELEMALHDMAPADRLVLRLRFEDGCTAGDIAAVVGSTQRLVYSRLDALMRTLRLNLEARGINGDEIQDLLSGPSVSIQWPRSPATESVQHQSAPEGR